ncbi:hypothetical protein A54_130 [Septuagintavirus sv54]|uniref:Uncharacterized protein n=1 Tax=Escherichia phage A5-4 TaxID=2996162 RepID=A0AAE9PRN7_9CAUD|nr:hypothetical protein A54_130 [Escherichia phage A5-4]
MKLKCLNVIADFKDVFPKGELFDATEMRNDFCDVTGKRPKRNGTPWTGVQSLGHVVVLGVAKFEIVGALDKESFDGV